MNAWIIFALVLLVLTSPGWGIVLAGYVTYKIDSIREERRCPACQERECPMFLPDSWRGQLCTYDRWRYDRIAKLEKRVLGEYPSIDV